MISKQSRSLNPQGFTIVELMIALTILSIILLAATVVLANIGQLYSKGVNTANVQSTTRNVVGDLVAALQFGDPMFNTGSHAYTPAGSNQAVTVHSLCFGVTRYSYILDEEESTSPDYTLKDSSGNADPQTYHVLWQDTMSSPASCQPLNITSQAVNEVNASNGRELAPLRTRLTAFDVTPTTSVSSLYNVTVGLAYGDNDLLQGSGANTVCTGGTGQEYCATSFLKTIAGQRL